MSTLKDRIEMLLMEEATGQLSANDRKELDRLLDEESGVDRFGFERAAAAVFIAGAATARSSMPKTLYQRILADSERLIDGE